MAPRFWGSSTPSRAEQQGLGSVGRRRRRGGRPGRRSGRGGSRRPRPGGGRCRRGRSSRAGGAKVIGVPAWWAASARARRRCRPAASSCSRRRCTRPARSASSTAWVPQRTSSAGAPRQDPAGGPGRAARGGSARAGRDARRRGAQDIRPVAPHALRSTDARAARSSWSPQGRRRPWRPLWPAVRADGQRRAGGRTLRQAVRLDPLQAPFQLGDLLLHAADQLQHRVRQVGDAGGGLNPALLARLRVAHGDHPGGHAHHRAVGGHVPGHDRPRGDDGAFADGDGPQDLGPDADDDVVPQGGVALGAAQAAGALGVVDAQGDALVEGAVVPDLGRLADDHAHPVVDEEALADLRLRGESRSR